MSQIQASAQELGEQFLRSVDKSHLGATAAKLISASLGEIVMIFSRSSRHRHYALADVEWMILPAIASGQFFVVEAVDKEHGFRKPIAALTWASVSEELDARLTERALSGHLRLSPVDWKSGSIAWLIDAVGAAAAVKVGLEWLNAGPFKDRPLKLIVGVNEGKPRIANLHDIVPRNINEKQSLAMSDTDA
jgi:hemolysin-activating ACP:hemolysin acyltransferase